MYIAVFYAVQTMCLSLPFCSSCKTQPISLLSHFSTPTHTFLPLIHLFHPLPLHSNLPLALHDLILSVSPTSLPTSHILCPPHHHHDQSFACTPVSNTYLRGLHSA